MAHPFDNCVYLFSMEQRFAAQNLQAHPTAFQTRWQAPSNIALIKYWGKKSPQTPLNASISFTLANAVTQTQVRFSPKEEEDQKLSFSIQFEGVVKPDFRPKIQRFFDHILPYQPFLTAYHIDIESKNTFPHSSGIASSASSMAALAACLVDFEAQLAPMSEEHRLLKTSFLARLGSGSASRSTQGPVMVWGKHPVVSNSSDHWATPADNIHPIFTDFCDTILLIDKGQKQVSSSLGHKLMHNHPYAEQRFDQANNHLRDLLPILESGDLEAFIPIVEKEALHLHAMMMTSDPYFILMKPNTLQVIEHIWAFRKDSKLPISFTLDAGANVHVLYPNSVAKEVSNFIDNQLLSFCEQRQLLHDRVGTGIKKY